MRQFHENLTENPSFWPCNRGSRTLHQNLSRSQNKAAGTTCRRKFSHRNCRKSNDFRGPELLRAIANCYSVRFQALVMPRRQVIRALGRLPKSIATCRHFSPIFRTNHTGMQNFPQLAQQQQFEQQLADAFLNFNQLLLTFSRTCHSGTYYSDSS